MSTRRGRTIRGVGTGLSLLVLGGLGGMAFDRMRFEFQRSAMLAHVETVIQATQGTPLAVGPVIRVHTPR